MADIPLAVVLDCDGTLADTEPIADRAWSVVLARRGYLVGPADFTAVRGRPWPAVFGHYLSQVPALGDEDIEVFRKELADLFVAQFHLEARLFEDAVSVIRDLVEDGVAIGVCSSSGRAHLGRVRALDPLLDEVAVWVGSEDTARHKPHPAPYLEAARRLGVDASSCVAIEDTPVGATSAAAAGMRVVGVDREGLVHDWPEDVDVVTRLRTSAVRGRAPGR